MLQVFNGESGEVDRTARIAFIYETPLPRAIKKVALVDGEVHELEVFANDAFIKVLDDPFRIDTTDHVYLNAHFMYGNNLRDLIANQVGERSDAPVKFISAFPEGLAGLEKQLSAAQYGAFCVGRPIWRRSALSSDTGVGERGLRSSLAIKLHDTLHSWLPITEMMAKHAMQIDSAHNDSKFGGKDKKDCTVLAKDVLARALGRQAGNKTDYRAVGRNKKDDNFVIGVRHLGIKKLHLAKASYQYENADKEGYFQKNFTMRRTEVSGLMKAELIDFRNTPRVWGERFDATALVEWAAYILIFLRLALAASLEIDKKRSKFRKKLRSCATNHDRIVVENEYVLEWVRGLKGTNNEKETVNVRLDSLLDLQGATLIAFAANINPLCVSPLLDHCIRSEETGQLLAPPLFVAAQLLGKLFCNRYLQLDPYHANILADYVDLEKLPKGLLEEDTYQWITAVKMITSFMTKKGLTELLKGVNAAVADGKSRTVYLKQAPQWSRAVPCDNEAKTNQSISFLADWENDQPQLLAPPILVEGGWLILPGDYAGEWFLKCNPFGADDL